MKTFAVLCCSLVVALASVSLLAHQETFKGTVMSVERLTVQVNVVDPKTKKETPTVFKANAASKVLRGDKSVSFADAKIQKGENIAVTVDHDVDVTLALVIRLDAAK